MDFKIYINWTPQAIDCYNRKCNCKGCILSYLESGCFMKKTVLATFAKLGKPPEPKPEPDWDYIYDCIAGGMLLKDIAKELGISVHKMYELTKERGINGRLLRSGELAEIYRKQFKRRK